MFSNEQIRQAEIDFYELYPDSPALYRKRDKVVKNLLGTDTRKVFFVLHHLHNSLKFTGGVCEFGVAQGVTSSLFAFELLDCGLENKGLYLYDSFEGLPKPSKEDVLLDDIFKLGAIDKYEGKMNCPIDMVRGNLKAVNFPEIHTLITKGFVHDVFTKTPNVVPFTVCFAYLDMDFYEPTIETLRFLDERLAVGGAFVIDDYDFFTAGPRKAIEEFMVSSKHKYDFTTHHMQAALRKVGNK